MDSLFKLIFSRIFTIFFDEFPFPYGISENYVFFFLYGEYIEKKYLDKINLNEINIYDYYLLKKLKKKTKKFKMKQLVSKNFIQKNFPKIFHQG